MDITDEEIDTILGLEVERFDAERSFRTYDTEEMRKAFRAGWGNRVAVS